MSYSSYIAFDCGLHGKPMAFVKASAMLHARESDDIAPCFEAMQNALKQGKWLAGFTSYELGYALEPKLYHLMPEKRRYPLLMFGVFDAPQAPLPSLARPYKLSSLKPLWDKHIYEKAFERVKAYIQAGDCYQINLTFPIDGSFEGDSLDFYQALSERQSGGYGAYIDFGEDLKILSRSPELFFKTDQQGMITMRPMKGTAARLGDDAHARAMLQGCEKNRAENLMIVDMIRHDLSRICDMGSVHVPKLFEVQSYETLHQMTSTICGQLKRDVLLFDVFKALFPCASITGAPKIRAMEIISELEKRPRGVYCGAIGWFAPNGEAALNVAIRTLCLEKKDSFVLNVGGGVVADSTLNGEYEEALCKARFVTKMCE